MTTSPKNLALNQEPINAPPIRTSATTTTTAATSSSVSELSSITEHMDVGSILHIRLSFTSNGIQLLPPYLEQPLKLSSEPSESHGVDIQPFLSLLSNLSTPLRSSSMQPSVSTQISTSSSLSAKPSSDSSSSFSTHSPLPNGVGQPSPSISHQPTPCPPPLTSAATASSSFPPLSPFSDPKGSFNPLTLSEPSARNSSPSHSPSPSQKNRSHSSFSLDHSRFSNRKEKRTRSASSEPMQSTKNEEAEVKKNRGDMDQVSITFMNLPFQAKKDELKAFFETCGPLKHCQFMLSNYRTFRGIAHVVYENPESASKALKLHNTMYRGREISVCYTDYSLLARNSHLHSKDVSHSNSSSQSKRLRKDHYSSTNNAGHSGSRKSYTVLLENLPSGLSLDQVHDEASKNGNVLRVQWNNKSKTSALLEYSSHDSAKSTVRRLNGREANDSIIKASFFDPNSNRASRPPAERKQPFILKISDLPNSVSEAQLKNFLRDVGPIEKLRISNSKHAAYLETTKDEVASAILAKNGQTFLENVITVAPYHTKDR